MKFGTTLVMIICAISVNLALANDEPQEIIAENGVALSVTRDDFAKRLDVSGPSIPLATTTKIQSYGFVSRIDSPGKKEQVTIQGEIINYDISRPELFPILNGGEPISFRVSGKRTVACNGSICQYSHHFIVGITMAQVRKYAEDGAIVIQFRSSNGSWKPTLTIPTAHFEAVLNYK